MRAITTTHESSPDPAPPDSGTARAGRPAKAPFFLGLVALVAVLIGANLVLFALLPHVVPGWTSAGITSGSMDPGIRTGDVVIVKSVDGADLEMGAVVTYRDRDGRLVTHRIVAIADDGTLTVRGDRNPVPDPPVDPDQVIGRATWIVPYVGLPTAFAANGQWLLLIATFVVTGVAVVFARFAVDRKHDPWRTETPATVPPVVPAPAPLPPAPGTSLPALQLETSTTENDTTAVRP